MASEVVCTHMQTVILQTRLMTLHLHRTLFQHACDDLSTQWRPSTLNSHFGFDTLHHCTAHLSLSIRSLIIAKVLVGLSCGAGTLEMVTPSQALLLQNK